MCDIGETEMALYTRSRFDRLGVPSYESPEDAARSMKALVTYGSYLKRIGAADEYMANLKKAPLKLNHNRNSHNAAVHLTLTFFETNGGNNLQNVCWVIWNHWWYNCSQDITDLGFN